MKQLWRITERYYPWLLLLLGVDCFCAIILWISDIQAFQTLIGLVVLTSLLLFSAILFVLNKRETTRRELFRDFLSDPTICNEERLLSAISREEGESIRLLASVLQEHKTESNSMADALQDYEEYVLSLIHISLFSRCLRLATTITDSHPRLATGGWLDLTRQAFHLLDYSPLSGRTIPISRYHL